MITPRCVLRRSEEPFKKPLPMLAKMGLAAVIAPTTPFTDKVS
jgi:hypothetical protein